MRPSIVECLSPDKSSINVGVLRVAGRAGNIKVFTESSEDYKIIGAQMLTVQYEDAAKMDLDVEEREVAEKRIHPPSLAF